MSIAFVIVSHSAKLAEGVLALAQQMAKDVEFRAAGGTEDGGIGTSFDLIYAAVEELTGAGKLVVLLTGLGFERGGLSVSHALTRGFAALPSFAQALHGETVAFGTLVQRVLEQPGPDALRAHASLLVRLGLPATFEALGQAVLSPAELELIGAATMGVSYIGNFDRPLSAGIVAHGLAEADRLGRAALSGA